EQRARQDPVKVVPADAGVFRSWPLVRGVIGRRPRRRGGVPNPVAAGGPVDWSSPPTRGCSAASTASRSPALVVPADAGVFRLANIRER
ncbi:hypothetical protein, partial [Streptomyces fradiae]